MLEIEIKGKPTVLRGHGVYAIANGAKAVSTVSVARGDERTHRYGADG